MARIVVAGDVDHGKSTLIAALLDLCPRASRVSPVDSLREERDGEMTIETTRVEIDCMGRRLLLVDVPGHRELIRNMLTGATCATGAVLVVAADQGVTEQTRRHARLLALVGVDRALAVVNKMDAAGYAHAAYRPLAVAAEALLAECGLASAGCIPICAESGDGLAQASGMMPWYTGRPFIEALSEMAWSPRVDSGGTCAVVQSVAPDGGGTPIVSLRVLRGEIAVGDILRRWPAGGLATVGGIRRFPLSDAPLAAGESGGVAFEDGNFAPADASARDTVPPGLDSCRRPNREAAPAQLANRPQRNVRRGDVLTDAAGRLHDADRVFADLYWFAAAPEVASPNAVLRCATQAIEVADIALAEALPGADGFHEARIDLAAAGAFDPSGRIQELARFSIEQCGRPVAVGRIRPGKFQAAFIRRKRNPPRRM